MGNSKIIRFDYTKMRVLTMHVFSFLFFVIFNLAVPSNQAKLANEGSDGDSQESHLPQMFESILRRGLTQIMENIENARILNWNIMKDTDPDTLVSTNEGIDSFFVDSNLNGDFTESDDDFTDPFEEFENHWDIIKGDDNLESTNSKRGSFADDSNIDDDFYLTNWGLTKAQWKIYGDCIINSCMTMVRPGGGEVFFKQGQQKQDCMASCLSKGPNKGPNNDKFLRKLFLAAGLVVCVFGFLVSFFYMLANCEAEEEKDYKKVKEQRIIEKLKVLSQDQFSDSDDSDDEDLSLKNPEKNLEKVYHVPASSMDNFKNFEYFEKLE